MSEDIAPLDERDAVLYSDEPHGTEPIPAFDGEMPPPEPISLEVVVAQEQAALEQREAELLSHTDPGPLAASPQDQADERAAFGEQAEQEL